MYVVSKQTSDGSYIDVYQASTQSAAEAYIACEDSYGEPHTYTIEKQ